MLNENFYLDIEGTKIHMKMDYPRGEKESYPLCIILHGITGHMEEEHLLAVSSCMNSLGIATLRIELYGHGQSGGRFEDHTIMIWVKELTEIIRRVRTFPHVSRLFLAAHSQGGLTAVLAAGECAEELDALLPLAPALAIRKGAQEGCMLGNVFDPKHIPEFVALDEEHAISREYIRLAQELNYEDAVAKYKKPVLLVHAIDDETIPLSDSEWLLENYQDARLCVVSGGGHCYDDHLEELTQHIRDFMLRML